MDKNNLPEIPHTLSSFDPAWHGTVFCHCPVCHVEKVRRVDAFARAVWSRLKASMPTQELPAVVWPEERHVEAAGCLSGDATVVARRVG